MVLVFSCSCLLCVKFTHNTLCRTVTPFSLRSYYECMSLNKLRLRFDCGAAFFVDVAACLATGKGNRVSINTMIPQMLRRLLLVVGLRVGKPHLRIPTYWPAWNAYPSSLMQASCSAPEQPRHPGLTLGRLMTLDHLFLSTSSWICSSTLYSTLNTSCSFPESHHHPAGFKLGSLVSPELLCTYYLVKGACSFLALGSGKQ